MDSGFLFMLVISLLVCGAIALILLASSGRAGMGFMLGLLLGPLGILVAAILRLEKPSAQSATGMKRCPDCAELVQGAARKCRFCGHEFAVDEMTTATPAPTPPPRVVVDSEPQSFIGPAVVTILALVIIAISIIANR